MKTKSIITALLRKQTRKPANNSLPAQLHSTTESFPRNGLFRSARLSHSLHPQSGQRLWSILSSFCHFPHSPKWTPRIYESTVWTPKCLGDFKTLLFASLLFWITGTFSSIKKSECLPRCQAWWRLSPRNCRQNRFLARISAFSEGPKTDHSVSKGIITRNWRMLVGPCHLCY